MLILITGAWNATNLQLDEIRKMGHEIVFLQNEKDELPCAYEEIEGVICNGLFLYHTIEKFTSLKYIQLTSAGYDRVPLNFVKENNIKIFNARGVYSIPMAEFALCGVLQIYKNVRFFYNNQKNKRWIKNRDIIELYIRRVCIVGCGNVGMECAKRFKSFGAEVFGIDVCPYQSEYFKEIKSIDFLDDELKISDIIILTLPHTSETTNLINEYRISNMKKNALIVNIARGAIVEENALIKALNNNHLLGAVLDVFENEPLNENSPLWNMENVIITPHNSFVGDKNLDRLYNVIKQNLELN